MADQLYLIDNMRPEQLMKLGDWVFNLFGTYVKDRKFAEDQWMKNIRQFRGIYDPDVEKAIPGDQSKAYPKLTRQKVIGTVARLMEMLYPRTDVNFVVEPSPLPDISEADLQKVLDALVAEKGPELNDALIEAGIFSLAKEKAKRLNKEITDQLAELDFVALAKQIVFSSVLYGIGILKGPMVKLEEGRTWTKGPDGRYRASTVMKKKPFFEVVNVWDWYTDMSAKVLTSTDADMQRHIFTRSEVIALKKRPDFIESQLDLFLKNNKTGNYQAQPWETELRAKSTDKQNVTDMNGRKYEAIEFWGKVSGQKLHDCGVSVPSELLDEEVEANIWVMNKVVIKATINPYDDRHRGYHCFVYEEDDINLLGNGLPVCMRDSQMAVCEASRMILDNGAVVCGPMLEVNHTLLMPGQDLDVYARKVWVREDTGLDAQVQAVREIRVDSHINELVQIVELFMGFADAETALPPPALGDVSGQGKESLRTTGNLSMLLGAAALPIRDTVRNYDRFTVSYITALGYWNMEFNPNENLKGDFKVIARGSTSLIAKEVRAGALNQLSVSLSEEERIYISDEKLVLEKLRVLDLPEDLLEDPDVVKSKLAERAASAQAQAQQQMSMIQAQIRGEVASAFKDLMLGLKAQAGANADTFSTLMEGLLNVRASEQGEGSKPAPSGPRASSRSGVAGAARAA